jgi:phosphoribosylamine--glycine ligase
VEVSVFAITDGKSVVTLDACHDYKRAEDGDRGPNTGGMGAICPTPRLDPNLLAMIETSIFIPVIHEMRKQGCPFQGVLFAGLMLTQKGPYVLEFNVRFGDPETQALMMRFTGDLGQLLRETATGKLTSRHLRWDTRTAVCVVAASGGYPESFTKGYPIHGLETANSCVDTKIFHAGTRMEDDRIITSGGRVLAAAALGETQEIARNRAYALLQGIRFTAMHYRKDIGAEPTSAPH